MLPFLGAPQLGPHCGEKSRSSFNLLSSECNGLLFYGQENGFTVGFFGSPKVMPLKTIALFPAFYHVGVKNTAPNHDFLKPSLDLPPGLGLPGLRIQILLTLAAGLELLSLPATASKHSLPHRKPDTIGQFCK